MQKAYRDKHREHYKKLSYEWGQKNKEHRKFYAIQLYYGITKEQYLVMLTKQNGCCAICGKGKPLVVDHDHKTKAVRGLLCKQCNSYILPIIESYPHLLPLAKAYLEQRPQLQDFGTSLSNNA